ncbi:uncharacterized protein [Hemitrygon akajei]|uniref:uncharacterized protein n=1 Tax=Hemitrygon akajei TaxID=2704970 RepID=UPI003BF945B9
MSSDQTDYDRGWPATSAERVERPGLQRQVLPTHLMLHAGACTSEEEDSYSSVAIPPPLPLQPPVGSPDEELPMTDIKPKRKFIPDSWKNFWRGRKGRDKLLLDLSSSWGVEECSPPVSPFLNRRQDALAKGGLSEEKPRGEAEDDGCETSRYEPESMPAFSEKEPETAQSYMERMHVYQLKHAYMKSWPGLLRVLGVMELLFGAMVFACICAYIQKDSQWYNFIGGSFPSYGLGNNYYYTGPKTPFVLVMVALAWVVTIGLLLLGLSLYYRTILLDSGWWPLTEFTMNTCLFFLYMAAGIVYVNGLGLGGLCYTMLANNPLYYQLCRVESGQIAATAFLFVNMLLYLVSAGVCLKVWRHELNRKQREALASKRGTVRVITQRRPFLFKRMSFRTKASRPPDEENIPSRSNGAHTLKKSIPAGFIPKPLIVPDYVTKYPKIEAADERERYKGVFNDQYAEYRELHSEIHAANRKFAELKTLIEKLPRYTETSEEHKRIMKIIEDYKEKKNDPAFVEKKQRCTYLKNKLSYIKQRIQEYDLKCDSSGILSTYTPTARLSGKGRYQSAGGKLAQSQENTHFKRGIRCRSLGGMDYFPYIQSHFCEKDRADDEVNPFLYRDSTAVSEEELSMVARGRHGSVIPTLPSSPASLGDMQAIILLKGTTSVQTGTNQSCASALVLTPDRLAGYLLPSSNTAAEPNHTMSGKQFQVQAQPSFYSARVAPAFRTRAPSSPEVDKVTLKIWEAKVLQQPILLVHTLPPPDIQIHGRTLLNRDQFLLPREPSLSRFASIMYESRPLGSPPAYSPTQYSQPVAYRPSMGSFEFDVHSPPPGSYYIEDKPQHFYKWSSPPGIVRILEGIVIILCLAIFACVASTLQWQYGYGYGMGYGGLGMGGGMYPGLGGGSYYPGMGGSYYPGMGGYGAGVTDPRAASGFMIAMAAISFIVVLAFFITSVSKSQNSRSRKFYLLVLVFSAILGGMELIASIVYIMGVNPTAGGGGSTYYSQIRVICSQFYTGGAGLMMGNQYLYHYCVVDPQEAVAIVCGFLAALTFCIIAFFAQKVRHKIWKYGKPNIIWDKNFAEVELGPNVEEWVKTVPAEINDDNETLQYSDKPANGINVMSAADYNSQPTTYTLESQTDSQYRPASYPSRNFNSTPSEDMPRKPPAGRRKGKRRRRRSEMEESQYETDYTTGAESGEDMDEDEWESLYPPITSDPIRQEYKHEFDADHQEYKQLCAEMKEVNDQINYLNKRLDVLTEDDPNYQGVAEEYNRLKDFKQTPEYQSKRQRSRQLKSKLSHIKRMVNDYDRQRE